jgi:hypothetical protein
VTIIVLMALVAVQVVVVATACPLLVLLVRDAIRRQRTIPSLATVALLLATVLGMLGAEWDRPPVLGPALWFIAFPLVFATFPDGRFVPRWIICPVLGLTLLGVWYGVTQGRISDQRWWAPTLSASTLLMLGAQVYRYRRRSTVEERIRTRWPVLGTIVAVAGFVIMALVDQGRIGEGSELSLVVAGVLGALPAYGFALGLVAPTLTNVDAPMRNVLLGLAGAILLAPIYLAATELAKLAGARAAAAGWWGGFAVAAATTPALRLARRLADWAVYRGRPDPMRALTDLSNRLDTRMDPLSVPDTVVRTVCEALFLDGAELRAEGVLAASFGTVDGRAEQFDVEYQDEGSRCSQWRPGPASRSSPPTTAAC